ncbi:MAG: hypothetical protein ACR2GY_05850 [Phycisphaerales bacterium]
MQVPTSRDLLLPTTADATAKSYPGLANVVAFAERPSGDVYSGSAPDGASGFKLLHDLGIRTIISVDGAQPNVEYATSFGIRYVHLPIGYDGVDQARLLAIARAIRDLPRPLYIHCHHGKHRSAAAAGAALVTLGELTSAEALARLHVSGTSPVYAGLYQSVESATAMDTEKIDAASNDFPEVWKTSGLVQSMVEADQIFSDLEGVAKADWGDLPDHPDLVPAAEAARLADILRHLLDDEAIQQRPPEFIQWLQQSSDDAAMLEDAILTGAMPEALSQQLRLIETRCTRCHERYRN